MEPLTRPSQHLQPHLPMGRSHTQSLLWDKDLEAVDRYQNQLRYNPTYYRNLILAPTREFIAKEITLLRRTNQTRRSQDRADHATEYRKMLHDTHKKK